MKMKKCNLIFACFIVFSILFIALPGFSQDSTLEVKCADSSGNPLKDVKVVAFNLGERKAKDEKTDARGVAEFKKMKDGIYRVFGHKDGFAPAFFEFVELKGSADTVTLNFAAGADKKLYFEDEAEEKAASELSIKGFGLLQEKKPAEAEPVLMQSLEISPSNTDTLYYLALANLQLGNFDQGVEFLKKTINIANMLKNVMADASGQTHYEETVQKAQQLLLKIPAIKGDYALRQKKYDAAIAGFSEAIKSEPENADYYANLAIALTNAKRLDEAVTAINKADQLKPGVYEDLKKNIETRKENQTLMEAQKILDDGKKLLKDGNAAEALKKFEEAKGMVPEDKQATLWLQIGQAQDKLNQPEAAAESFKKTIEIAPPDKVEEFGNSIAQYYIDVKKYDKALDVLSDPKVAGSQGIEKRMLSIAQKAKSNLPQFAEAALERALKANPDNADTYFELGQQYYFDKIDERSKELLTKYLEMGKDPTKIQQAKDLLVMLDRRNKKGK